MVFQATIVKVMIASPGDVANERQTARDVINEWNVIHAEDRRSIIMPVAWETNATPAMGDRAQEIINKQLLRTSDLLVAIFWIRLGTPTGVAKSGTSEEIEEHLHAGKPVMLYFSATPVRPDSMGEVQYQALREFKASMRQQGLVEEYESLSELREKFARQLAQTIIQRFPAASVQGTTAVPVPQPEAGGGGVEVPALLAETRELLKEATQDPQGNGEDLDRFPRSPAC